MTKRLCGLFLTACFVCGVAVAPAMGEGAPAPGWAVSGAAEPTNLPPGSNGRLALWVLNTGAVQGTGTLTVTLPAGMTATGDARVADPEGPVTCTGVGTRVLRCEITEAPAVSTWDGEPHEIPVHVSRETEGEELVQVSMAGGGAAHPANATIPVTISAKTPAPGLSSFNVWFSNADGTTDTQAGSHPFAMTASLIVNTRLLEGTKEEETSPIEGGMHNLVVNLPPGIVGNAHSLPECTLTELNNETSRLGEGYGGCPADSQIGVIEAVAGGDFKGWIPIFNMVPPPGVPAQFGASLFYITQLFDVSLRSGGDYGLSVRLNDVVSRERLTAASATIWGDPGSPIYNPDRFNCEQASGCSSPNSKPLLTLPTSCGQPLQFSAEVLGAWDDEGAYSRSTVLTHDSEGEPVGFTGCEQLLHFNPALTLVPETSHADSATGLEATVKVPQEVNPEGLATAGIKDATVVLPEGMAINPGQASGLVACQQGIGSGRDDLPAAGENGESEAFSGPPSCPAASKVGEAEVATPLLPDRLKGDIYVLQSNPPEVKLLVAASGDGVNIKLVGTVHLNEATGRLTTTFESTPDAPVSEFKLMFSGGPRAALVTPPTCRVYSAQASFAPWSGLEDALAEERFAITSGPEGTPCADPQPFAPTLSAGASSDMAGNYTDFSMLLQRGDGQQRISKLQFKTPAGLLGMISKIPLCPEPQASKGECSAASQIGHTVVAAGPGSNPLYLPEAGQPQAPIYLTGGYEGAPYGLTIVMPIVAGPFTLPTQIIRAKIEVDPHTAQLTITTDPLPTIIAGVPADLRSIYAEIDRPGFMFNPTNCTPAAFAGTATSVEGATAALASRFQVGACPALTFAPGFKVSTAGRASKKQGASLNVEVVYPKPALASNQANSQANIASVKVDLPKQLPTEQRTLEKACPAAQFEANPAGCPADSIVGHATAVSPVLPVPLTGPAYFVSHGGEAFPNLVVVLQGYGVTVDLVGTTFINGKTDVTSSTFKQVPDVPISTFDLDLPQGAYSALGVNLPKSAHDSFCGQKLALPTAFTAQDGAVIHESTPLAVTGCAKAPTRAQRRAAALKACRKKRNGAKRAACERAARKRYA